MPTPPTLQRLDKSIPIVGSPSAAKVARQLGFTQVTALKHGEIFHLDQLTIQATLGSAIGPTVQENGYLIRDLTQESAATLYYEPHGFHPATLQENGSIEVVITPMMDLALPIVGAIIKGADSALELAKSVKPQFMLPTAAGGDILLEGLLLSLLKATGSPDEFRTKLAQHNLSTQVLEPKPGDRINIPLSKPVA